MSTKRKIVATSVIGVSETLSEKHTIVASFCGFENLPHKKGFEISSPEMACHGHKWQVCVFPGGDSKVTDEEKTWISVYLEHTDAGEVKADFTIRVASEEQETVTNHVFEKSGPDQSWGWSKFLPRDAVLNTSLG
jgi:hypothetical protein